MPGNTVRGDPVMLNCNADPKVVVLQHPDGSFLGTWEHNDVQLMNVVTRGSL